MKIKINLDTIRFKKEQAHAVIDWLAACVEILQAVGANQDLARLDSDGIEVRAPEGVTVESDTGDEHNSLFLYPSDLADLLAGIEKAERKK